MSRQRCNNCKKEKPLSAFPFKYGSDTEKIKTCELCRKKKAEGYEKRTEEKNQAEGKVRPEKLRVAVDSDDEGTNDSDGSTGLSVFPLDAFLDILRDRNDALHIEACVDISGFGGEHGELKDKAAKLASLIWDALCI